MDFPVESYSFLPGSRAILDLSYRSRLRNSNYAMSQQSIPTISMGEDEMNFTRVFVSCLIREDPGTEVATEGVEICFNRIFCRFYGTFPLNFNRKSVFKLYGSK